MAKDENGQLITSTQKDTSALRAAAQIALSESGIEQKQQSQRDKYLADRNATRENFVANIPAVINSLKDMQGANGNKFFIRSKVQNFKEKTALKDDGTYRAPEIEIAIACNTSIPYDFKYNEFDDPNYVLYKHASYTSSGSKVTHDIDLGMNGLFLTEAKGTLSKRVKGETSYSSKPAIGLFIRGEDIQLIRMDKKTHGWGFETWHSWLRHWEATTSSTQDGSLSKVFNGFSSWVMENAELSSEDLLTLADAIEKPHNPSIIQRIKNKWTLG